MRILIAEDEFSNRRILQKFMKEYGECDVVVDGDEALEAFKNAWEENRHYDLILLDIMMPKMDGQETLRKIREFEKQKGVVGFGKTKIIMVTALDDPTNVVEAFYQGGANSYLVKPAVKEKLEEEMQSLGVL